MYLRLAYNISEFILGKLLKESDLLSYYLRKKQPKPYQLSGYAEEKCPYLVILFNRLNLS